MKFLKKLIIMIILTFLCVILIDSYKKTKDEARIEEQNRKRLEAELLKEDADKESTPTDAVRENYVTFMALGQNYMDQDVIASGKTVEGTMNYDFLFKNLSPILEQSDVTAVAQGMVIAGNSLGVSGNAPSYNSPEELCDAYVNAGIDVMAMANTRIHSMGSAGIQSTIDLIKSKSSNMHILGVNPKNENAETDATADLNIVEANGIKIALLNYTAVLSGSYISNEDSSMVEFFGNYHNMEANLQTLSDKTLAQIDWANNNADFVIVFACWGLEYKEALTNTEKVFAKQLAEAGVDVIIGNRPNYLQEVEWITADNGNRTLCYYSLGNFVSTEDTGAEMLSGIAKIGIKVENGLTVIDESNTGVIPVVTQYVYDSEQSISKVESVVPLKDFTEELAANHGVVTRHGGAISQTKLQEMVASKVPAEMIYTN